jgi:hypothetical protein
MDKNSETWKNLQRFANEHKLILEDEGEVGFGRPCVGFIKSGGYVDYNPMQHPDYEYAWERDARLKPPPQTPNAYHKHQCMAVLVQDDDYDSALEELNEWVKHLEAQGEVYVTEYKTGATGIQAILSGVFGYAVRMREETE